VEYGVSELNCTWAGGHQRVSAGSDDLMDAVMAGTGWRSARGGNQSNLNGQLIRDTKIPLPDFDTQRAIVTEIQAEQALVDANKQLIDRFEAKVKATINRVWGDSE